MFLMDDKTMSIADFAKRWKIGSKTMRDIIATHDDFPAIRINKTTTKRKAKVLVLVEDADAWIKRNLR